MAARRYLAASIIAIMMLAGVVVMLKAQSWAKVAGPVGAAIISLLAIVVFKIMEKKADKHIKENMAGVKRAEQGAVGEEVVGDILARLPGDCAVFHDMPCKYGNIDHVVLSNSNGLFVIETKSHRGKITATGGTLLREGKPLEKDFISQAWRNAYWLRDTIKEKTGQEAKVKPVIVFTNGFVQVRGDVKGVTVTYAKALEGVILKGGSPVNIPGLFGVLSGLQKGDSS